MFNTQTQSAAFTVDQFDIYVPLYTVDDHLMHCDMLVVGNDEDEEWLMRDPDALWVESNSDDVHEVDSNPVCLEKSKMKVVTHVKMDQYWSTLGWNHDTPDGLPVVYEFDGKYWAKNTHTYCMDFIMNEGMPDFNALAIAKAVAAMNAAA